MALYSTTFSVYIDPAAVRRDGTRNVKIRVTHGRRSIKVATHLYAVSTDLTKNFALKNYDYLDQTEDIIRRWRGHVAKLGEAVAGMTVQQIVAHIKDADSTGGRFRLDFIAYAREVIARKSEGTARVYKVAVDALEQYAAGRPIDIKDVNARLLAGFDAYVRARRDSGNARAAELYLSCVRNIHNTAKREFNDEDAGVIRITGAPFRKFEIKKAPPRTTKRAVSPATMQAIIDLPDGDPLRDIARDTFLLSFALAGMNAADLYSCPAQRLDAAEPVVMYNRQKTRTRRADGAEMHIRIEPCVQWLANKHLAAGGATLFDFAERFGSARAFRLAAAKGLLLIEQAIGAPEHFTFYSARHSWATIARSRLLNIDKWTVHEGLNHVDSEMRVTDGYIERDYGNIWDANAKILAIFDWSRLEAREMLR